MFRRGLKRRLRRTLIIHTKDGKSIRGVLVGDYADCLVLAKPHLLDSDVSLAGEAVILRENVSWGQDVTGVDRATSDPEEAFQLPRGERP